MKDFKSDIDELTDAVIFLLGKQTVRQKYSSVDSSGAHTVWGEREIPDEEAQEIIQKLIDVRGKK
jgi:hypothetical protein